MAGTSTAPLLSEEPVVFHWLTEFLFVRTWKEFSRNKSLSESSTDLLQGLFLNFPRLTNRSREMRDLITILCRLSDGMDVDTTYGDDSVLTPLEEMLLTYEELLRYQPAELQNTGQEMSDIIRHEAVVVCLRQKKFDKAQEVLQRLWSNLDRKDKKKMRMRTTLKILVDSKDCASLKDYTYQSFLDNMLNFLEGIADKHQQSFLMEMARRYKDSQSGDDSADRTSFSKEKLVEGCEKATKESRSTVVPEKKKLRKLWKDEITEMYGTVSSGENTNNSKPLLSPPTASSTPKSSAGNSPFKKPVEREIPKSSAGKSPVVAKGLTRSLLRSRTDEENDTNSTKVRGWLAEQGQTCVSKRNMAGDEERPAKRFSRDVGNKNNNRTTDTDSDYGGLDINDDVSEAFSRKTTTRVKWTFEEMVELYRAVEHCGVGNWTVMRRLMGTNRTNVQLKDKWRTMEKNGDDKNVASHIQYLKSKSRD